MLEKLKELFNIRNQKKTTWNLIILLFAGTIVLLLSNYILSDKQNLENLVLNEGGYDLKEQNKSNLMEDEASIIEAKLEQILKKIKGVGEVYVMVTFEETAEKVPVFNTTQIIEKTDEKDSQGGIREVTREDSTKQIVLGSSNSLLMVIKETKPKIRGVIVVAEGAENMEIKEKLYTAVKTVLGVSGNRVEIYSSN